MSDSGRSKRKLKNIQLTKQFHLKYYGLWFIISMILISLLAFSIYLAFEEHWASVLATNPSLKVDYFFSRSRFVSSLVFISSLLAIGITCLGIFTTHRIAGPLIKLQTAFEAVKGGNLGYRIKFRKEDELSELESAFNEMMDSINPQGAENESKPS